MFHDFMGRQSIKDLLRSVGTIIGKNNESFKADCTVIGDPLKQERGLITHAGHNGLGQVTVLSTKEGRFAFRR